MALKRIVAVLVLLVNVYCCVAQRSSREIKLTIINEVQQPLTGANVQLLKSDSSLVEVNMSDKDGLVNLLVISGGQYIAKVSYSGYQSVYTNIYLTQHTEIAVKTITLQPNPKELGGVVVTSKKPLVQFLPDKTVVNVDAGITNAGTSIMDVLERSPGITVGKDGSIIMKGKPSVMVLIDGKQTQLNGTELQSYLSGINASDVDVIELIDNPGAKYDAAGNAGIINIKTKKSKQRGFNGALNLGIGQGFYNKNNSSISFNYRTAKYNFFVNYGFSNGTNGMDMYALRKYFNKQHEDSLLLNQPNFTKTKFISHNLKTGIDFFLSKKTTAGIVLTGNLSTRHVDSYSTIDWMSPSYVIDSTIITSGTRNTLFKRGGVNFNFRNTINTTSEISADIDYIKFNINGDQDFQTQLDAAGSDVNITKGNIPSALNIFTAKVDYSKRFKHVLWESGLKTAITNTDNLAEYYFYDGSMFQNDLSRSNHFLYDEKIHSAYSSLDMEKAKWHWQGGLRYEFTTYKANQLGNAVVKDSSFKKDYGSLFPSAFVSYNVDSSNNFTLRFGRRIDRPQFQNLNPFLVTINKYTFEAGNPFIKPQYTWNVELVHTFKQMLSTSISYNYLKDYFSQIFIIDSNSSNINKNTIIYTRGNVGRFQNIGATVSLQVPVAKWWSLTAVAVYNHKAIEGVVWAPLKATVDQLNISLNNQFQFGKGWAAELSGYYQTHSQIDLQESLTPQGELDAGVSKQVLKNKGTIKFSMRDIFHTQNYSGYSHFENADEPFKVKWDSQVARLSFSWRFGKTMKAIKRSNGGATDETNRVDSGN